ncbi:MAG TPA: alpha/beta hydrolase [Anaerolineales bacterium]
MEMQRINIDGINLAYVRRGRGMPLVLIHGYPLDHSIWDDLAPLLEGDFELIIPDLRGFGQSDVMEADDSMLDYARDIAGVLTRLRIQKAFLAGHSMGGYVAMAFAREYEERVSGLAMVASQTAADTQERKEGRRATARQVLQEGVGVVVDAMAPKLSADGRVQQFVRALIPMQPPLGIAAALTAMADRPDSSEIFAGFPFPVTVVHGDADALIPVERAREMKAALPSAHYVELHGVGHMPMMENPAGVAEALRFFHTVKVRGVKPANP